MQHFSPLKKRRGALNEVYIKETFHLARCFVHHQKKKKKIPLAARIAFFYRSPLSLYSLPPEFSQSRALLEGGRVLSVAPTLVNFFLCVIVVHAT